MRCKVSVSTHHNESTSHHQRAMRGIHVKALDSKILWALALQAALVAPAGAVPVANGLVLNFQSDNIDGSNNSTLTNGQEVTTWVDVIEAGGHATQNNATAADAIAYLDPASTTTGTPNYVAMGSTGRPALSFTRGLSQSIAEALGFNTSISGLSPTGGFTAFVVSDINNTNGGPGRIMQFGIRNGANGQIVGLGNDGFRFNGNSKSYTQTQFGGGANFATYSMDLSQPVGAGAATNATFRLDGATGTLAAGQPQNGAATIGITNNGFAIGAGQNNSSAVIDSINGQMYAVLLYNRVLSATETQDVETFLYEKFIAIPEAPASLLFGAVAAACAAGSAWSRARLRRIFCRPIAAHCGESAR